MALGIKDSLSVALFNRDKAVTKRLRKLLVEISLSLNDIESVDRLTKQLLQVFRSSLAVL